MARRKIGDVIWLALHCAKEDRQGLVDAYGGDASVDAVRDALSDVAAFEALQIKLFGTTKTELQAMMDKMTPKSIIGMLSGEITFEEWSKPGPAPTHTEET